MAATARASTTGAGGGSGRNGCGGVLGRYFRGGMLEGGGVLGATAYLDMQSVLQ